MQQIDPSSEEIAAATAEIRAGWSKAEQSKRAAWAISEQIVASVVDDEVIDAAGE